MPGLKERDGQIGVQNYSYDFNKELRMSSGIAQSLDIRLILMENIPGAVDADPSSKSEDRTGTDWWIKRKENRPLSIDIKVRKKDYQTKGEDDLALETWSVKERGSIGWTRDANKATDFVLWFWVETGRWCLIPFQMLCKVFQDKWKIWSSVYGTHTQFTPTPDGGYHSECIFAPRKVVWDEIIRVYGGKK